MPATRNLRSMLAEGDGPMSAGRAAEVAALVIAEPKKASPLVECLWDDEPGVVNRAADALERASCHLPSMLESWKAPLLGLLAEAQAKKVRWNLALMVPRLSLTASECVRAAATLRSYLEDRSSIVKTCALQGLADLTHQNPSLGPEVLDLLRILGRSGTPAMRARSRILLRRMEGKPEKLAEAREARSDSSPEQRDGR